MLVLLAFFSLAVGVLIGATGVGGVLLIPVLMLFAKIETHQAMATALFSFLFTGMAATWIYQRYGSIDWKLSLPVLAGSFLSSYAGAYLGAKASSRELTMLLAGIIILSSLYSVFPAGNSSISSRLGPRGNNLLLLGIGLFTGFLCGMTGAGGGIVSIPLMLMSGYPVLQTIATGQVLQFVVSLSGSFSNHENNFIVFELAWWVTLCELAGIVIGVRLAHTMPVQTLKKAVTLFCLCIGGVLAIKALLP